MSPLSPSPELLAPAGSFATALAAFDAGADAVYLGLDAFSARAQAVNFSVDDLRRLLAFARVRSAIEANRPPKRVYVTFNTLLDEADLPAALEKLALLDELHPDGLIVQDLGVARLVRRHFPTLALHASTQLVAHNLEGVLALRELGFVRVVLARELSLEDVASIARRGGVEIETFVHGALCYSISGLCLFSALEKDRSGNRGKCAYCCRLPYVDDSGGKTLPFSMRDLRLDDRLESLRAAGVASLKIEGRMKSELYVASVVRHYRELLDGVRSTVSRADLETVFSRRTTHLYADGYVHGAAADPAAVIDPVSLGHLGTSIGAVKRVTRDREGRAWLRFHTSRPLEKHDGLQFAAPEGGKPLGFGIGEMRVALSRKPVCTVAAGDDVEVLLPPDFEIEPGATVYCSASNDVRRRFPVPSFRPADYPDGAAVSIVVTLRADRVEAQATAGALSACASVDCTLAPAQHPERSEEAVRKCFAKLGDTAWRLDAFRLEDPDVLFAPASVLNELRRQLVAALDEARLAARARRLAAARADLAVPAVRVPSGRTRHALKLRLDQLAAADREGYDEVVVSIGRAAGREAAAALAAAGLAADDTCARLAVPVFTLEREFNALRSAVKHLLRLGYARWEAADLATLRMLRKCGAVDVTADWSLYAFNSSACAALAELGVTRFVASPENDAANLAALAQGDRPVAEFLDRQSTPLFISLTRPAAEGERLVDVKGDGFDVGERDGLWCTTAAAPRTFTPPAPAQWIRTDLSWDRG